MVLSGFLALYRPAIVELKSHRWRSRSAFLPTFYPLEVLKRFFGFNRLPDVFDAVNCVLVSAAEDEDEVIARHLKLFIEILVEDTVKRVNNRHASRLRGAAGGEKIHFLAAFTAWDRVKKRSVMIAERQSSNIGEMNFRKVGYRRETRDFIEFAAFSFGASSRRIFSISVICSLQSREDSLDCNHSNFWHLVTVFPLRLLRGMFFVPAAG